MTAAARPLAAYTAPEDAPSRPAPYSCAPTPWGAAHHYVRCAGPSGLPEAELPARHAAAVARLVAVGLVVRERRAGLPVLVARSPAAGSP